MSESDGSQYLGRVGGHAPCSIITQLGKMRHFCFNRLGEEKQVANSEKMVLIDKRRQLRLRKSIEIQQQQRKANRQTHCE